LRYFLSQLYDALLDRILHDDLPEVEV
jgi:hypothetical protein